MTHQLQEIPNLLLALVMSPRIAADIPVWHLVTQPVPRAGNDSDMAGLKPNFLVKFPEHGLLGGFPAINTTLRELPTVRPDPFSPEYLVPLIEQDDADVRAKSVPVEHNLTPNSKTMTIMHGTPRAASGLTSVARER